MMVEQGLVRNMAICFPEAARQPNGPHANRLEVCRTLQTPAISDFFFLVIKTCNRFLLARACQIRMLSAMPYRRPPQWFKAL